MGCQIVSVYADQMLGTIGYTQQQMNDLYDRDHLKYEPKEQYINHKNIKQQIKAIYGYTRSYTQSYFEIIIIKNIQYMVYNVNNFLYLLQNIQISPKHEIYQHNNIITCFEVKKNLCCVGCTGGQIVVWDLVIGDKKIEINLPRTDVIPTSIGLTLKYIFCSDNQTPNNKVYCYDFHTSKLKTIGTIQSLEPTFKGKSFGQDCLLTICADGLWYSNYQQKTNQLIITKGMFKGLPKTSMSALTSINNQYVITGGVDGYIFVWENYSCQRVYKMHDSTILNLLITPSTLISSSVKCVTKCCLYELKPIQNYEEYNLPSMQLTYSVLGNFQSLYSIQNLAQSKINTSVCYLQSRGGQIMDRIIPESNYQAKLKKSNIQQKKFTLLFNGIFDFRKENNQQYLYNVQYLKKNDKNTIFSITKLQIIDEQEPPSELQLQLLAKKGKNWEIKLKNSYTKIQENYDIVKHALPNSQFAFNPEYSHLCYINQKQQIIITDATSSLQYDQLLVQEKRQFALKLDGNNLGKQIKKINYVLIDAQKNIVYLLIEIQDKIQAFKVNKQHYQIISIIKVAKKIMVEGYQINYNQYKQKWQFKSFQMKQEIFKITQSVHQSKLKQYFYGKHGLITVGNGFLVQWKPSFQ